jgi:hypothetical protein
MTDERTGASAGDGKPGNEHSGNGEADQTEELPPIGGNDEPTIVLTNSGRTGQIDTSGPPPGQLAPPTSVLPPTAPYGGPPAVPPGAQPPVALPAPTPEEPFVVRNRWRILAAAVVFAVLVAGAILLIVLNDGGKDKAATVLSSSAQEVDRVNTAASQATRLDGLQAAGREANVALNVLGQARTQAADIGGDSASFAVLQVLDAEETYLQAVARLEEMTRRRVGQWRQIRSDMENGQSRIASAAIAVQELGLDEPPPLLPSSPDIDAAIGNVDTVIRRAQGKLANFEVQKQKAREEQVARSNIQGYADRTAAVYQDYFDDRDKTRDFFNAVESGALTGGSASAEVDEFVSDRNDTIAQLNALSPPPTVSDEHQQLIAVVQRSLDGLDALRAAVGEYYSTPVGVELNEVPAWAEFDRISDEVTASYGSAKQVWETAVQGEYGSNSAQAPRLPDV